jgi:hypothetical protein
MRRQALEFRAHLFPREQKRRVVEMGEVGGFLGYIHEHS